MTDIWFDHLSRTLNAGGGENGLIAYLWRAGEDRFEWAGNTDELLGLQGDHVPRCNAQFHKLVNQDQVPARMAALYKVIGKPGATLHLRYKLNQPDGSQIDIEETATVHIDEQTGQRQLCGFLKAQDMDRRGKTSEETAGAALVKNISSAVHPAERPGQQGGRAALQQMIERWFDETQNGSGRMYTYLLVVGMDHLSLFNEAFGARHTDEIIEKTQERLSKIAGDQGRVCRIDGDVFGIFFDRSQQNEMAIVAKYILDNFQTIPLSTERGPVSVSVSIGGAEIAYQKGCDSAGFIIKAESAMHEAKHKGRNCFVCYKENPKHSYETKALLASGNSFIEALNDGRVRLAFQPVISAADENVSFHECLIRYVDESGKLYSAADFIPAVERLGLGQMVDLFALRKAIQELTMFPDLSLSVNVSHLSLTQQDWLRDLVVALRDRPSVANRLIVEITESTIMEDIDQTLRIIKTLQDIGCRVALDDFGAGNTAFSQLHKLNIDIVKIDKQFIRNIDEEHNHLFVKTLQTLAHGIDAETVGEGAETLADAKLLAGDGVNHIQGYVYGFPQVERVWLPKDHSYRRTDSSEAALALNGPDGHAMGLGGGELILSSSVYDPVSGKVTA